MQGMQATLAAMSTEVSLLDAGSDNQLFGTVAYTLRSNKYMAVFQQLASNFSTVFQVRVWCGVCHPAQGVCAIIYQVRRWCVHVCVRV